MRQKKPKVVICGDFSLVLSFDGSKRKNIYLFQKKFLLPNIPKVCLKELSELFNCLRIMRKARIYKSEQQIQDLITEVNELISIFDKSISTATKNH